MIHIKSVCRWKIDLYVFCSVPGRCFHLDTHECMSTFTSLLKLYQEQSDLILWYTSWPSVIIAIGCVDKFLMAWDNTAHLMGNEAQTHRHCFYPASALSMDSVQTNFTFKASFQTCNIVAQPLKMFSEVSEKCHKKKRWTVFTVFKATEKCVSLHRDKKYLYLWLWNPWRYTEKNKFFPSSFGCQPSSKQTNLLIMMIC